MIILSDYHRPKDDILFQMVSKDIYFHYVQVRRHQNILGFFPSFFLLTIFITKPAKQIAKIRDLHELDHKHVYFHLSNNLT